MRRGAPRDKHNRFLPGAPSAELPANGWRPREYQLPLWRALWPDKETIGARRAIVFWHRRAGKDEIALHHTAKAAHLRVGNYWHMLPVAEQARKAIWDAVNPQTGMKRIDEAFPLALRATTRDNDMQIKFRNGSTWQVVGSDNYDRLVGASVAGVVFSEWAMADPNAWSYLRPILAENQGWALFITTPRGRNHAHAMYEGAAGDPTWFTQLLTADDTGVFTPETLVAELAEYQRERGTSEGLALFRQEFHCSFDEAIIGAYYAEHMRRLDAAGQIVRVQFDPSVPVETWWDLGVGDSTAIWFVQRVMRELHFIDYIEANGKGLDWYAGELADRRAQRGYVYSRHVWPHDGAARELGTGKTRVETAAAHGLKVEVQRMHAVDDGISAVRNLLPRCWFDAKACERGIKALREYQREWDERKRNFKDKPFHNWASHGADAFRYGAMADDPTTNEWGNPSWDENTPRYPAISMV